MKFLNTLHHKDKGWVAKKIMLGAQKIDLLSLQANNKEKYPYFLDSSSRGNLRNRFSILFYKPEKILKKYGEKEPDFLERFDKAYEENKVNQSELIFEKKKIPFCGGWFIYLGYELVKEIEPSLEIPESPFKLPTAFASRIKTSIILDHIDNEIFITSDDEKNFLDDCKNIETDLLKTFKSYEELNGTVKILTKGSEKEHQLHVKKCIDYIFQGEIFQANLSRLWEFEISNKINEIEVYKQLRKKNPAPFSGLVNFQKSSIICSSPERLISVDGDIVETRPIAGTRPRGSSAIQDIELSKELINSDKEKAEHLMLVDLERNDISRICKPGSVKVNEMMSIESYAHVHHIVSNVRGKKLEKVSPGNIIASMFPGGTITGCPKVRCMEILGELEKVGRGPYTGSFGYITHSGNMDINILIRSILKEDNKLFFRAGGGIVADSIPKNETFETEAKANGMLRALRSFE